MYSYGPPHMAGQKQDDQLEHTYSSSYVRIQDIALKTCQRRWTIGRSGERGSRISVPMAQHDDGWYRANDRKVRAFADGSWFNPRSSHTKDSKMVVAASLVYTEHYKVWIKEKWSNSRKGVAPSSIPRCFKLLKKEPSGHPRLRSDNLLVYIYI